MISTRALSAMPDLDGFRRLTRSVAMLEAILSPDWASRYYSFDSYWGEGEMMASMRDGCGDQWFALLSSGGIALVGLAHEAPMYRVNNPWRGIFDSVPAAFANVVAEPAFDSQNATFCVWRENRQTAWQVGVINYAAGDDPDGSERLLSVLDGCPETYWEWAQTYYEQPVNIDAVRDIYANRPLTEELIHRLNPDIALSALAEDIRAIGYPDALR